MDVIVYLQQDFASQWIQQYRQKAIIPSMCSNYTMPHPDLEAGHKCLLDGINIDPGSFSDLVFTMEDCFDVGGNWTSYSCEDLQTIYTNSVEKNGSDMLQILDMTSESMRDICCNDTSGESTEPQTKEEIKNFWWNAAQEWREGHSKNIIIIKGVMSMLSVIASSILVWMIFRSHDGLSTIANRLLLGLCTSDIFFSLPNLSFGMMVPNEVGYVSWNAMGSMATCQIQGFVISFGSVCGPCYNASLCLYYLAVVKYKKSDDYIRTKIEPFLHAVPWIVATIHCVYMVASARMNAGSLGSCSAAYYSPPHCSDVDNDFVLEGVFEIPCGRGKSNFNAYFFTIVIVNVICPFIIMIVALAMIYMDVRQTEQKMSKYGVGSLRRKLELSTKMKKKEIRQRQKQSRLVMYKALAYSSAWLLTWILYISYMIVKYVAGAPSSPALIYAIVSVMPLQGVYNLAIYMHPEILNAKRKSKVDNVITWRRAFVMAFWSKGRDKKKNSLHNVRVPPNNRKNTGSDNVTQVLQNSSHLSFGRLKSTETSHTSGLPKSEVGNDPSSA